MELGEKILVIRIRGGDPQAFEEIYNKYYAMLHSYILSIIENRFFVEDIIEDVFVTIWEKRIKLEVDTSLKGYLFATARNACLDFIRKKNVRNEYKNKIIRKESIESGFFIKEEAPGESDLELKKVIKEAINQLPRKCRKVFKLSRYFQFKNKEIAHRLNISENTVEKHMNTALAKLREALSPYLELTVLITLGLNSLYVLYKIIP